MRKRLKGSTLVETITALVIILIVYTLVVNFFVNHAKRPPAKDLLNMHFVLKEFAVNDLQKKIYQDETFQLETMIIDKVIAPYNDNKDLLLVTYQYKDKDQKILMEKKYVVVKE